MAMRYIESEEVLKRSFPDPLAPLRVLVKTSPLIVIYLIAVPILLPSFTLVSICLAPLVAGSVVFALAKLRAHAKDLEECRRVRLFQVDGYKIHPDEQAIIDADAGKPASKRRGSYWRHVSPGLTWTPMTERVEHPDGTIGERSLWRRKLIDEQRPAMLALRAWLKENAPGKHALVVSWWEDQIAQKIANELWPGRTFKELSLDQRKLVWVRGECEFYQGCFIVLRPDTWHGTFDNRPTYRPYSLLRQRCTREVKSEPERLVTLDLAPVPEGYHIQYMYLGEGYEIQKHHTEQLYYRSFFDRAEVEKDLDPEDKKRIKGGDPWLMGVGWRDIKPVWSHFEDDLRQHSVIGGGSGYGKTRVADSIMLAGIHSGRAVVILDPKIDKKLTDTAHYEACRAGREDQVVFMCVARSDLPYNNTFNPLAGILDPSQIGSILASMMPADAGTNQAFLDEARNIGRGVGTLVFYLHHFLTMLSDGDEYLPHPPRLVLWLEYLRIYGVVNDAMQADAATTKERFAEAQAHFTQLWDQLVDSGELPRSEDPRLREIGEIWAKDEFSTAYWKLHFGHLNEYALQSPQRLVAWVIRLLMPYLTAADKRFASHTFPDAVHRDEVVGPSAKTLVRPDEKRGPTLKQLYLQQKTHLLEPGGLDTRDRLRGLWAYAYEMMLPPEMHGRVVTKLTNLQHSLRGGIEQASREPEDYGNFVTNLRTPIQELIAGNKRGLLCVSKPDITWERIHRERLIVILALGTMSDQKASDAVSKAFVNGLLGYGGYLQARGETDIDLLFIGDEMFSWVTGDWAHIADKMRGTGVATVAIAQSQAGMEFAVGNPKLFKHIMTNVRNQYTVATPNEEDAQVILDSVPKVEIYKPVRNTTESPAMGNTGHKEVAGWSTSETWNWNSTPIPLMEPSDLAMLPLGQAVRRVQGRLTIFQAPYVRDVPVSFRATIGMNQDENPCEIEGVDYNVEEFRDANRVRLWGTDERLADIYGDADEEGEGLSNELEDLLSGFADGELDQELSPEDLEFDEEEEISEPDPECPGGIMIGIKDDDGLRCGSWRHLDPSGTVWMHGHYRDGQKHGRWERIDGGDVVEAWEYQRDAVKKHWRKDAEPKPTAELQILSDTYEDAHGNTHSGQRRDGYKVGIWRVKRADGTMLRRETYDDAGNPDGVWVEFDETGTPVKEIVHDPEETGVSG